MKTAAEYYADIQANTAAYVEDRISYSAFSDNQGRIWKELEAAPGKVGRVRALLLRDLREKSPAASDGPNPKESR